MNSCTGEAIAVKENGTEGRERERERDTDEVKMIISHSLFHKRIAARSQNKKVLSCHERNDSYCCRSVYPLTQSSLLPPAPSSLLSSVLYPEGKSLQMTDYLMLRNVILPR